MCNVSDCSNKFVSLPVTETNEDMLYPIGIQNFEDLRRSEYVYVDKTHHIHRLASTGKYYFLSRPRRFGKSLLVSTMEAYFKGKKELFEGLAIEELEKDWVEYPVLHLDLNGSKYMYQEDLVVLLSQHLDNWEKEYCITARYDALEARFRDVIDAAYEKTGKQVVILVDEYDKPIVNNLDNKDLSDYYRAVLQGFYGVIKSMGEQTKFCFLTGVSKIGKLSVFSGLNNLKDISMVKEYADICGDLGWGEGSHHPSDAGNNARDTLSNKAPKTPEAQAATTRAAGITSKGGGGGWKVPNLNYNWSRRNQSNAQNSPSQASTHVN